MSKFTDLLEKFEDTFKAITPDEMEDRFEKMSDEELAEYILEDALASMRTYEYNQLFGSVGGFDDEKVQEAMEAFLENYVVEELDHDDMIQLIIDIKSYESSRKKGGPGRRR